MIFLIIGPHSHQSKMVESSSLYNGIGEGGIEKTCSQVNTGWIDYGLHSRSDRDIKFQSLLSHPPCESSQSCIALFFFYLGGEGVEPQVVTCLLQIVIINMMIDVNNRRRSLILLIPN